MIVELRDLYFLLVFLIIAAFLFVSSKKRLVALPANNGLWSYFQVEKKTSIIIKGIGCVFVLMGHYVDRTYNLEIIGWGIPRAIYCTTANIALVWFVFFSGYGLSIKSYDCGIILRHLWLSRILKVYLPLIFVCLFSLLLFILLGSSFLYSNEIKLPQVIYYLHNPQWNMVKAKEFLVYGLGIRDWFVVCIIYFYSLFYLSIYLSRLIKLNHSICLSIVLLLYYILALNIYQAEQAHFFRYPWAFFLGHIVAAHKQNTRIVNAGLLFIFSLTLLPLGIVYIVDYIIAVMVIVSFGIIDRVYILKSKFLLFLGGISYLFYLSHERIGWVVMSYLFGNYNLLLWIVITIVCSSLLDYIYKPISAKLFSFFDSL